ncbi:MAG: phosphatidate cytidylyltransferase [Pseudomonadales bacterium]
MLRARIITAVILAPLVIAAIYLLPLAGYALFFWLIAAAGTYEWAGLAGLVGRGARIACLIPLAVLALVTWQFPQYWQWVLWLGAAFWALAAVAVIAYPRGGRLCVHAALAIPAGLIVGWAAWMGLVVIRAEPGGANWVLWLLFLVWGADIGAYFAGRRFGRRKLAPQVSPGKTWEGLIGGIVVSLLLTLVMLVPMGAFALWWVPVIVGLVVVSVFGDLFESVMKRARGVKDSGALLPGHGGVLDRIDSVVAVLPVFAVVLVTVHQVPWVP